MGKGYISVKLQKESSKLIKEVMDILNISGIDSNKLHITVMYDKSNPDIDLVQDKSKEYKAKITGVERLGEKGSKWEAIALVLECPELEKRHKFLKAAGFKHSYPEYKCHMSLMYGPKEGDLEKVEMAFKLNGFPEELIFDSEKIEQIKD